jgi:hypothetical protein
MKFLPDRVAAFAIAAMGALGLHPAWAQAGDSSAGRCRIAASGTAARLNKTLNVDEFRIRYATEGPDALADATDANGNGIPDAIDDLVIQLTTARSVYVDVLGLRHPLRQPRYRMAEAINVSVMAMAQGNGLAFDEVSREKSQDGTGQEACALSFAVNSRLQPHRNITPAHELLHLFQYGYAMFKTRWYLEGMTRWMETAFVDNGVVDRDALRTPYARCEDVFASASSASPYWRAKARAAGRSGAVQIPPALFARTYVNGQRVFSSPVFEGGRFAVPVLEALQKLSAEVAAQNGLARYNWPEDTQRSDRFDAQICQAVEALAGTLR